MCHSGFTLESVVNHLPAKCCVTVPKKWWSVSSTLPSGLVTSYGITARRLWTTLIWNCCLLGRHLTVFSCMWGNKPWCHRWDRCLNVSNDMAVWCITSAVHVPCIHRSQSKVPGSECLLPYFLKALVYWGNVWHLSDIQHWFPKLWFWVWKGLDPSSH